MAPKKIRRDRRGNGSHKTVTAPGPRVGLVLSGGGAKGFAHIGVIDRLIAHDIPIDLVAGSSMGAMIGAAYCSGMSIERMNELATSGHWSNLVEFHPSLTGLLRIQHLKKILTPFFEDMEFKDLKVPLIVVATDLVTGEEIYLESGSVVDAVCASSAIPGLFTPMVINGRTLIDGGTLDILPTVAANKNNIDKILAVDCLGRMKPSLLTNIPAILMQSFYIIQKSRTRISSKHADYLLSLNTDDYTQFDFSKKAIQNIIAIGRNETDGHIHNIKRSLVATNREGRADGLIYPKGAPGHPIND